MKFKYTEKVLEYYTDNEDELYIKTNRKYYKIICNNTQFYLRFIQNSGGRTLGGNSYLGKIKHSPFYYLQTVKAGGLYCSATAINKEELIELLL